MPKSDGASKRLTIKDVARMAGVSPATVSNVLNGRTSAMTEETLNRIRESIDTLHYRPSSLARGLVTQRTATIGLILVEVETPLFLQALSVIEPIARDAGYSLLLCVARNLADEKKALDLLLEKQVEGVAFLSTSHLMDDSHILALRSSGLPVVLINRTTEHDLFDRVYWDNAGGLMRTVEYLANLDHRHIALMVGPADRRSTAERLQGYERGLQAAGLEFRPEYIVPGDYTATRDTWERSAHELLSLSPRPTAIIAADDTVATVVMRTAKEAGIRVPQDLTVVGIDDQPFSTYLDPALTTIHLPISEAGKLGMEMLLNRIVGRVMSPQHVILSCHLVVRQSSARSPLLIGESYR